MSHLVRIRMDPAELEKLDAKTDELWRGRGAKSGLARAATIRALIAIGLAALADGAAIEPHLRADPVKRGRAKGTKISGAHRDQDAAGR